jgi:Flp pilus assembly protein TadG
LVNRAARAVWSASQARHRRARQVAARFVSDHRGTTAVQAILLMPVVLFFFAAAVVTWQTVNIRKSLNDGVYRAVRYLSLYPPPNIDSAYWQDIAREFIEAEMLSNPWTKRPISDVDLRITITIPDSNECGDEFTLEAGYRLFAPIGQMDGGSSLAILPNNVLIELEEERDGMVICD